MRLHESRGTAKPPTFPGPSDNGILNESVQKLRSAEATPNAAGAFNRKVAGSRPARPITRGLVHADNTDDVQKDVCRRHTNARMGQVVAAPLLPTQQSLRLVSACVFGAPGGSKSGARPVTAAV